MTCREFELLAPALARAELVDANTAIYAKRHLDECIECRQIRDAQGRLSELLRATSREDATLQAPPEIRANLLRELRATPRHARAPWAIGAWTAAAALAIWAVLTVGGPVGPPTTLASANEVYGEQPFTPIPASRLWEPSAGGRIMRVNLPGDAPLLFGFPVSPGAPTRRVEADILLGNDGTAHAIRFLPLRSFPTAPID